MMGRSHALSGAVGWLAGCAALTAAGAAPAPAAVVFGTAIATGMALAPDVDHPKSTIAHSVGHLTRMLAGGVSRAAGALRTASCGHCSAGPPRGGHRAVTHTALGAAVAGLVAAGVCVWAGRAAVLWIIGFSVWLAAHTALSTRTRARVGDLILPSRFRRIAPRFTAAVGALLVGAAGAVLAAAVIPAGVAVWWVGLAVTWGWLAHSLGDALTFSAVPLWWPLRIRGCRWTPVGAPRWARFRTGSPAEAGVVWLMLALGVGSVVLLGAVS
ncbi:metal-dependent hydrolase [Actinoplanes flavus]|uniref:Metal-dependent hydrolase n=1 Tax=Actinoplanes flavus TaxID=2820290 RepID=A0ABS3UIV9_9ACTN|nr:metal-dependent hydrolase [Actinoplanes flavus]MBO3738681.1 metal-dependent hydrolase [Actinoplanes flavus]